MGNATSWLAQTLCPEEQVLWVAAKSGELELLRAALARLTPQTRFYLEWRDPLFGYSPLANASAHGHAHCVRELLAAGADARARDVHGNTPLHLAAKHGKGDAVRALLQNAPAPDALALARNASKQQTPLDVARHEYGVSEHAHKFVQCIELLEQVGGGGRRVVGIGVSRWFVWLTLTLRPVGSHVHLSGCRNSACTRAGSTSARTTCCPWRRGSLRSTRGRSGACGRHSL